MARHVPHRSHMGVGHSAVHSHEMDSPGAFEGRHGDEDISLERKGGGAGPVKSGASGGPIDMRPQLHEVMGTVGGIGKIAGPLLTGVNIGPINAAVYENETAEGDSGEL